MAFTTFSNIITTFYDIITFLKCRYPIFNTVAMQKRYEWMLVFNIICWLEENLLDQLWRQARISLLIVYEGHGVHDMSSLHHSPEISSDVGL